MAASRYVVMGAGEVGFHLARTLSLEGHDVAVVEADPDRTEKVREQLDVLVIRGNGAHPRVLEAAGVASCDLFMAVSSSDESNLVASKIAKDLGALRSVVRVGVSEQAVAHRNLYRELFGVDLLLSTQLLTRTRILNHIRGHNTVAVEHLADGKVQLRKVHLDANSPLTRQPLKELDIPAGNLIVALFRGEELIVPSGDDRAEPGDDALILGAAEAISLGECMLNASPENLGTVVLAGCGATGQAIAQALHEAGVRVRVRIIEIERRHAEELAERFPNFEVLHGDATDINFLRSERIGDARTFVALSGNDESNLMASLIAQELGVPQELALVQRAETSRLWSRIGLQQVFSPRALANERIHEYIEDGYNSNIVSLRRGQAVVLERTLVDGGPTTGVTLAQINPPRGLRVGAVVRGEKVFVPRGRDRLEAGDKVILFAQAEEIPTVRLLFPGQGAIDDS